MTDETNNNFSACDMATAAAQGFRDGVASVRPAAAVVRDAFMKMRNVAAGYSNCCEFDSANTRRLEREFEAADELYRSAAAPTPEPASPWSSVEDRLPQPGVTVLVFTPQQPGDYPDDVRISLDGICPESDGDYWLDHGAYYEHWCCIAKGGADIDWQGPSEKAPYTHWMPLPSAPEQPAEEQDQ